MPRTPAITSDPQAWAEALAAVEANFARMGEPGSCTRCGGTGYRDEWEGWVVVPTKGGKVCFRCGGDGVEPVRPYTDPRKVRAAVIARMARRVQDGDAYGVGLQADRARENDPFYPVLWDIYDRAREACEKAGSPIEPPA
jgi:hypothetical protein